MAPYSFCWITNSDVLIGAFFVPTAIVLLISFVLTTIVIVQICQVRSYHDKLGWQSVFELFSIFFTCSGGLIALVVMGTLLVVFADSPNQLLIMVAAVLFVIQALAFWVVIFPRRSNMTLWAMLFMCQLGKTWIFCFSGVGVCSSLVLVLQARCSSPILR